jgi:hypothetical protein
VLNKNRKKEFSKKLGKKKRIFFSLFIKKMISPISRNKNKTKRKVEKEWRLKKENTMILQYHQRSRSLSFR